MLEDFRTEGFAGFGCVGSEGVAGEDCREPVEVECGNTVGRGFLAVEAVFETEDKIIGGGGSGKEPPGGCVPEEIDLFFYCVGSG